MTTKLQRELESKVHEQLYDNIFLLTLIYPPSDDFTKVFKKDMFAKNNKRAFQFVVYYLLNILDPEKLKQKVLSWPIYDMRMECQFRNEVVKYINELNCLYEDAGLPTVMTSHAISPGGYKFAQFMLKLSQLVIYEHLQKDPEVSAGMLHRIRYCINEEVTENIIKRINKLTQSINETTRNLKVEFENKLAKAKIKANDIVLKQEKINAELPILQDKYKLLEETNDLPADVNVEVQEELLHDKYVRINNFDAKFQTLFDMVTSLSSSDLYLDYNSVANISSNQELNLVDLLEEFLALLNTKFLEMKILSPRELSENIEKYSSRNEDMSRLCASLIDIHSQLEMSLVAGSERCNKQRTVKGLVPTVVAEDTESSSILAEPLDDTTSSDNFTK